MDPITEMMDGIWRAVRGVEPPPRRKYAVSFWYATDCRHEDEVWADSSAAAFVLAMKHPFLPLEWVTGPEWSIRITCKE